MTDNTYDTVMGFLLMVTLAAVAVVAWVLVVLTISQLGTALGWW